MRTPDPRHADLFDYPSLDTGLAFVHSRQELFQPGFASWLRENWAIYKEFHHRADALWRSGRRHYGARTIIESIRYDTDLREGSGEFKINNRFIPDLARLYVTYQNDRNEFFERRLHPLAQRAA